MSATIVTGATSTLGSNLINYLIDKKQHTIAIYRDEDKFNKLFKRSKYLDAFRIDLKDSLKLEETFARINELYVIKNLVCCHGHHEFRAIRSISKANLMKMFELNVFTTFELLKVFNKYANIELFPSVVLIGSVSSIKGETGLASYSASKSSLIGLTKTAARELAIKNIRINIISPGWVDSERSKKNEKILSSLSIRRIQDSYPLGFGKPYDVTEYINFLISDVSRWVTGQHIIIDGGYSS